MIASLVLAHFFDWAVFLIAICVYVVFFLISVPGRNIFFKILIAIALIPATYLVIVMGILLFAYEP